jgi:uncharacterized repeat protein (TIGR01451 family)
MSPRGRYVGVALVLLAELAAALVLGLGSASAESQKSPFRTAQITGPCLPQAPPPDCAAPPPPDCAAPPLPAAVPSPVAPGPVDPPTPSVSLRVRALASAAAGQSLEYRISVENITRAPAHHVTVRNPLPANATFVSATPNPDQKDPELLWRLGTLEGGARREIVLVLAPTGGDVTNCARVSFEHGQCVTTRVSRPQLTVRKTGPTEASLNDMLTFRITVTNTGSVEANDVVLVETLPAGLQHGHEPFDKPKQLTWRLGSLAPGKSHTVEYQATARATGALRTAAEATAAGGILSDVARHTVTVGNRVMTLEIEGPRTAYVRRAVNYFLTVKNEGNLPVSDVVVTDPLPEGLEFEEANQGGRVADNRVQWRVGTLAAGQSRILQLRVRSDAEREVRQMPAATAGGGLKASTEITTKFAGAAGFDFDVDASAYAVEVDTPVRYVIRVFNRGTGAQTAVRVVAELPPEMEFKEAKGPDELKYRADKGVVTFDPLPSLAVNSEVVYEVVAVARKVGGARARVGMAAAGTERLTYKPVLTQVGEKQPP